MKNKRNKKKRSNSLVQLFRELNQVQKQARGSGNEASDQPFVPFYEQPQNEKKPLPDPEDLKKKGEKFSERVIDYVERPEKELKAPKFIWLKELIWPSPKYHKKKKEIIRMDTPGLTTQQKIWIGTQTIISSLLPLLLYLVLPAFMMYVGMILRNWNDSTAAFVNASGNFYYAIGIVLCFFLIRWKIIRGGESFRDAVTLYWENPDWKKAAGYAILGIAASVFLSAAFTLLPFFTSYKSMTENAFRRTDLILAMISVFITAPICEEIIFRGLMLNRLLSQFSERAAVILTSAIFAACHGNLAWICYAFVMGWLLAFVSVKEDNIFYSIILHMAFNLWTVLQLLIRQSYKLSDFLFGSRYLVAGYGLLAFLGLVAWFRMHPEFVEDIKDWMQRKERI